MTTLHFPSPGDWLLSDKILDAAAEALDNAFTLSRDYHIPYVAGYSKDGKTLYIDKRMPDGYEAESGKLKGQWVPTDRFLMLHEAVEKILLDRLKVYQLCHQIALRVEEAVVKADGVDWDEYNDFMAHWIEVIEDEGYTDLPPDLDETPYLDEDDAKLGEVEAAEAAK